MRIIVVPWIPGKKTAAVTLPPFCILIERAHASNPILLAHEKAHWEQYEEWGFWGFYRQVFIDYVVRRFGRQSDDFIEIDAERRRLNG